MQSQREQIAEVFQRVDATLQTAQHGYEDLDHRDKKRRMTGLRNLIVFGRSVTFVLQNLRSVLNEGEFDHWYEPEQVQMRSEPLLRFFLNLRNVLEKQGKLDVSTSIHLKSFSTSDIHKFYKPRGAEGFFIGDELGGSGWVVKLADGSEEKYYVDLPDSLVEANQQFADLPDAIREEFPGQSVDQLSRKYLDRLDLLVRTAKNKFMPTSSQADGKNRSFLRVVK